MIHNSFYFILGRENKISQAEIQSVLASFCFDLADDLGAQKDLDGKRSSFNILSDDILEIKLDSSPADVASLINIFAGTVKIFEKIAPREANIVELLENENISEKIIFGISNYQKEKIDTFKLALSIKRAYSRPMRIVDGKDEGKLSSAQSFQYQMDGKNLEYGLFATGIGRLIAVQNIEDWSKRDYGKPRSDATSGMLPPKLARMMVNLAVSQVESMELGARSGKKDATPPAPCTPLLVVDPFCGSGNILLEAVSLGLDILGSDISEKAVEDTRVNLEWLLKESGVVNNESKIMNKNHNSASNTSDSVFQADAIELDFSKIDRDFVIVTEPYLGKPRKAKLRIEEEVEAKTEISKLYIDFLQNLKLTAKASKLKTVLIVFPLFELANGKQLSIWKNCVDTLREIGYTTISLPLIYGRDYQVVKRQIVSLKP